MLQDPKILSKVTRLERTYEPLRYFPIAELDMEFAETRDHLRTAPADGDLAWQSVSRGHGWGDDFITGWFRGSITVAAEHAGKPLGIRAKTGGPETMFLVDEKPQGVFDVNHPVRRLTLSAESGRTHRIHLESYAGHTFPGTQPFEDARTTDGEVAIDKGCRIFEAVELVEERPEVGQFIAALRTLRQIAGGLEESSLRRATIIAGLGEVFKAVSQKPDELDESEWRQGLRSAIAIMQPLLAVKNSATTPFLGVIGHSHIDTAWLWPVSETWRKCARTFSSVLALMDEFPEFRFTSSAALHMDKLKELYPDLFARVQARVKEGRWEINGAMWIEPDCNIPSGESFVRQCLFGQRATQEMFGVVSDTLWQPDVFGYSAALPQILQKSRVEFFCTTKLSWNDTNRFPYDTFHWQGIDGTSVLAHFNEMQGYPYPEQLIRLWKNVRHMDVQDRRLVGFGHGDGGGGPMAEMIESLRLTSDVEGCPRTGYQDIGQFMVGCRDELHELPTWVGELYLELHRGTLTSIAAIKRWNRACEFALQEAELWSTLATLNAKASYPRQGLSDAWKKTLLNHFHDILPGSAIKEVNDEAVETFEACFNEARSIRDTAAAKVLVAAPDSVTIGNMLSWPRTGELQLSGMPEGFQPAGVTAQAITDVAEQPLLAVDGLVVPALGYKSTALEPLAKGGAGPFSVAGNRVETPSAIVTFDDAGRIVSFIDRAAQREIVRPGGAFNELLLGEDVPAMWDNWDIDRDQRHKMAPITGDVTREVIADGPLQLRIRFKRSIGKRSSMIQDVVFHAKSAQVDFDTRVDWHEKYQFLKSAFDVDVLSETALHEIQFGHVQRNSHDNTSQDRAQFDVCAHKWTDISEGGYGVAFLNDCKYACTVKGYRYQLSLIKSGRHPDARGDEGVHRFAYALLPHQGAFSVESVVRPAFEFNVKPSVHVATGSAQSFGLLTLDQPNVIVAAVKLAEDSDDLIVRVYEAGKAACHTRLHLHVPVQTAVEVNLLEEGGEAIEVSNDAIQFSIKPFEIKTFKFRLR